MFLESADVDNMFLPCSDEFPAGSDIRGDRSLFRPLRNQYNAAKTSFRQLLHEPDLEARDALVKVNCSNWGGLSGKLIEIISSKTKDLELLSWLCECQLFGPAPWQSLGAGVGSLVCMVDLYWLDCHPGAVMRGEESGPDISKRVTLLRTLFGEGRDTGILVIPVRMAPLIGTTTLADFLSAEQKGTTDSLKGSLTSVVNQNADALRNQVQLFHDLSCQARVLDERLAGICSGVWSPGGVQPFIDLLKSLILWMDFTCAEQVANWPDGKPEEPPAPEPVSTIGEIDSAHEQASGDISSTTDSQASPPSSPVSPSLTDSYGQVSGPVRNRVAAYQQLQSLADYFRWAEPHSPVVCLLDRALQWGQMSVSELMQELLKGHSHALERVDDLTGLLAEPPAERPQFSGSMPVSELMLMGNVMEKSDEITPAPEKQEPVIQNVDDLDDDTPEPSGFSTDFNQQLM